MFINQGKLHNLHILNHNQLHFSREKLFSEVFCSPNLHDTPCDNTAVRLVMVDSQFTSGCQSLCAMCHDYKVTRGAVPELEAGVKKEPPVQAEGKGISARPPGCWPSCSLFASGSSVRVKWSLRHIVLLSRSSSVSAFGRWPAIRCTGSCTPGDSLWHCNCLLWFVEAQECEELRVSPPWKLVISPAWQHQSNGSIMKDFLKASFFFNKRGKHSVGFTFILDLPLERSRLECDYRKLFSVSYCKMSLDG